MSENRMRERANPNEGGTKKTSAPAFRTWPSLRGRITAWTAGVFTVTLVVFAIIGILGERRRLTELEAAQARGFLAHLAGMPEFQKDPGAANARLALLLPSLRNAGGEVRLVALPTQNNGGATAPLAVWPLSFGGDAYELEYHSDGERLRSLTTHSVALHLLYGVLALGALVSGLWSILTRSLVGPLGEISGVIDRIRSGNGWLSAVPQTDAELSPLARSVLELGPGLEAQVYEWIGAERRSAVALAYSSLRSAVEPPLGRMRRSLEGTLPGGTDPWRERAPLLLSDLVQIEDALLREEKRQFRSHATVPKSRARRLMAFDPEQS